MKTSLFSKVFKRLVFHLIAAVFYSLAVLFFTQNIWSFLQFFIGVILGVSFTVLDEEFLAGFYQDQEIEQEPTNENLSVESSDNKFIVTQSPLYLISLIPTSIFIFTSSGSFLAMGIMGGLLLFFLVEMGKTLANPEVFYKQFFVSARFEKSKQNLERLFGGLLLFFVVLHFLVLL